MKYLFIGGSKDGEMITVHEANRVEVPVLEEFKLLPTNELFKDQNEPSFTKESYRRESFKASTGEFKKDSTGFPGRMEAVRRTFTFFVQDELSFADVMAMLIEGYRKPTNHENSL